MSDQKPFKPLGDPVTHYWLAQSMAKAAGVDLGAEFVAGRLSQDEWATLVTRCRGCDWERDGGGCARWLSLHESIDGPVPRSCENHERFDTLTGKAG